MSIYGYCRISTKKQNIDRQIRNIQEAGGCQEEMLQMKKKLDKGGVS